MSADTPSVARVGLRVRVATVFDRGQLQDEQPGTVIAVQDVDATEYDLGIIRAVPLIRMDDGRERWGWACWWTAADG